MLTFKKSDRGESIRQKRKNQPGRSGDIYPLFAPDERVVMKIKLVLRDGPRRDLEFDGPDLVPGCDLHAVAPDNHVQEEQGVVCWRFFL